MKLKFITTTSIGGQTRYAGEEVDSDVAKLSDSDVQQLLDQNLAVKIDEPEPPPVVTKSK